MEAVTRLNEFSFLGMRREVRDVRSYKMHKLVQEATRYGLSVRRNSEDEAYFSNAALQIMVKPLSHTKARSMGGMREVHRVRSTSGRVGGDL